MGMTKDYKASIDKIFFDFGSRDLLYKDGVKPYEKDKFRFQRALEILKNPVNKTIYEIGPYPGIGIYYFGESNSIIGLGKSTPEFDKKVQLSGHRSVDIDFEKINNIEDYKHADIVLVMEVLEHIRMSYQFIENITKMVKPGGYIYMTTNNQFYAGYILKLLFNKGIFDPIETEGTFYPGHCRYYELSELQQVFEKFGLEIVSSNFINFLPDHKFYKNERFGMLKNFLLKHIPRRFSTHIELLIRRPE